MLKTTLAAAAAASLFALGACGQTTTVESDSPSEDVGAAMEEAGDNIEEAADQAGDEIEEAGDNAADAVDDATDGNPNTNP
ncbi:MAG: hypothetical protein NW206_01125 [Hyphomonadaceae bacterium]|nr:hypothetical protein [Hyphomonadaceae bacterium]